MLTPVISPTDVTTLQTQVAALQLQSLASVLAADFPKTNTTYETTALSVNLEASTSYAFELYAPFNLAGTASGFKIGFVTPASITGIVWSRFLYTSLGTAVFGAVQTTVNNYANALATAANHNFRAYGTIMNGVNAGAFAVQFAQNTADAAAATLLAGSTLICRKL